jgi:hypothetical protein
MSPTEQQLLSVHRAPSVRLQDICEHYLSLSWPEARRRAARGTLPFPTYRLLKNQKLPLLVRIGDLARVLDAAHSEAHEGWVQMQLQLDGA